MISVMPAPETHAIGRWSFDVSEAVVRSGEEERRLENRSARTLAILCEHRGCVVGKEELISRVWQGRAVSPNSIAVVIGDLRRVIEDDPGSPVHIVTVNKRGYRLSAVPLQEVAKTGSRRQPMGWRSAAFSALAAGFIAVAWTAFPALSRPMDLVVRPVVNETDRPDLEPLSRSLDAVVTDSAVRLRNVHVLSGQVRARRSQSRAWTMRSRLIMWNGAPELAITIVEDDSGRVIWSGFAGGPPKVLAKAVADRIATFEARNVT
jgi:DNA-binding winged helix-turn-helix (wHTH) protein